HGLARGYLGRPDLTAEKFLPNPFGPAGSRLYRTGDLARFLPDGTLETLGRIDNQVKIRGYRIELGEIEARLREHPHVLDAVVTVREPQPGHKRLTAHLVPHDNETPDTTALRTHLTTTLPDYMVPATFVVIDSIPLTTNGKINHRALPAPELISSTAPEEFTAPRTPVEKTLAAIWSDVLGVERVSVEDSFFGLGGDSIRAVQVLAAGRAAGLTLAVWMILQARSLGELAAMASSEEATGAVTPAADGSPLTPGQFRLLDEDASGGRSLRLALSARPDPVLLGRAFDVLVRHHAALHAVLAADGSRWEPGDASARHEHTPLLRLHDLRTVPADERASAVAVAVAADRTALDPGTGTLVRASLVTANDTEPGELWLTVHGLAVDTGSWPVLVEDLNTAYARLAAGLDPEPLPAGTPWHARAADLVEEAASDELAEQAETWLNRVPGSPLPLDRQPAGGRSADDRGHSWRTAASVTAVLSPGLTAELAADPDAEGLLLAALGRTLAEWSGGDRVEVDVVTDPRRDPRTGAALSRTVGLLTDRYPVSLRLPRNNDPHATATAVGRQLRAVPEPVHGYGLLRHLAPDTEQAAELAAQPDPQVLFALGPVPSTTEHDDEGGKDEDRKDEEDTSRAPALIFMPGRIRPEPVGETPRRHLLEVDARFLGGQLYVEWTFSTALHDRATVQRLADRHVRELGAMAAHTGAPRRTVRAASPGPWPRLRSLMEEHGVPGASVALIEHGEVTAVESFGVLGVEQPEPVTAQTLFPAASISKHVTTYALLRLVTEGLVDLDRDVNAYLESWQVPQGPAPVTVRELLGNRSGLAQHPRVEEPYRRGGPVPTVLDVLHGRPPARTPRVRREEEPGRTFRQNQINFSVLQQAMCDLTGKSFDSLVHELLFEPLGMTGSGFDSVYPDSSGLPFARGHDAAGRPVPDGHVVHPETAAGGLWTTARDLAALAVEIRRGYLGRPGALVASPLVREMLTAQAGRNYGWSTILDDTGADLEFGHGGQAIGYQAMTGMRAQSGSGAVLLSNAVAGRELVNHLLTGVWAGQERLAHLWRRAIAEATERERAASPGTPLHH
ncbi:serine hydrolase, partial [Streptomyces sp. NPDC040724]|uniref:serine hydrolase domain-containing protein n=1 Tax=Streptomyces sp. NPDC040724 TaxID=3155612 RepID=UPI0033C25A9A